MNSTYNASRFCVGFSNDNNKHAFSATLGKAPDDLMDQEDFVNVSDKAPVIGYPDLDQDYNYADDPFSFLDQSNDQGPQDLKMEMYVDDEEKSRVEDGKDVDEDSAVTTASLTIAPNPSSCSLRNGRRVHSATVKADEALSAGQVLTPPAINPSFMDSERGVASGNLGFAI